MKLTFTKLAVAACCLFATSSFAQLLTPEVLYYKFDGSGTSVPNYASAPPVGTTTATIMGGITQGGTTLCDGSLIGSGVASSTDYLNTGWAPNLGAGTSWSVVWRASGISTNATLYYIFGDANTASFRCFTNGVAGSTNWILRGAGLTDSYINGGALTTATMCAYVYNSSTNTVYGYLNGVLVSTTVQAGTPNLTGTGPLKVMGYSSNVGAPAGGLLDEYRFYSRALTATEIATLYNPYTVSGFLGADFTGCSAGSVALSLPNWPNGNVLWSTGATTDTTSVSSTQLVTVDISGNCGVGSDTVMVTIAAPTANTITISTCDQDYVTPGNDTLVATGMYMDTIPNMAGCDSVITINYTRNMPTTSSMSVTACSMYMTPSGGMIMSSGTYMDTIPNSVGCDSVITINATINQPSTATLSPSVCDMYMSPAGNMYTTSGTYMDTIPNMAGCDSVITINLTVNTMTSSTITASSCGWYLSPGGDSLMSSGTYMDTIPNMAGCDSIITINLTINTQTQSSINASTCGAYTAPSGAVYTQTGTYMDTIPNMAGCDSIITIALNVTTVNAGASVAGQTCTATGTTAGATFQWLNCSGMTPINGATSISYTATANGSYCVVLTIGNCSDTSSCVSVTGIGIEENAFAAAISIYPNPNSGNFTINLGSTYNDVTVVITDLAGRVVYSHIENSTNMIPVQLDAAAGSYVITVTSGENTASFRMNKN